MQTTPGGLAPVYSLSPVTITLRRLLSTGKTPPALDAKRRGPVLGVVDIGRGRMYCPQAQR